jgi:hypothetical protein
MRAIDAVVKYIMLRERLMGFKLVLFRVRELTI